MTGIGKICLACFKFLTGKCCPGSKLGRTPKWAPPCSNIRGGQEVSIPDESSSDLGRHTHPASSASNEDLYHSTKSQGQPEPISSCRSKVSILGAGCCSDTSLVVGLGLCWVLEKGQGPDPQDSEHFPKATSLLFHSVSKNRMAQAMIWCETQGWGHQLCVRMVTKPWPAPQLGSELLSKLLAGHIIPV